MFDLLIRGGTVMDGTGAPPFRADVGVAGDTIADVGDLASAESRTVLDVGEPGVAEASDPPAAADGLPSRIVCPGFIDTHSHSDAYLLIEPSAPSKVFQGVTTEVVGNCGASAAPLMGEYRMPSDWTDKGLAVAWTTMGAYRAALEQARPAPNVVCLVGHGAVRAAVVGYANRAATADEMDRMERLLEQCLDEGAAGLSSGLIYPPGLFAPREELVRLAAAAARRRGLYATHMRSESARVLEAVAETLSLGRTAGVRVQISHLKVSGRGNWGLMEPVLDRLRSAGRDGVEAAADCYPYTSGWTDLDVLLPDWAREGGRDAILARLRDPEARARISREMAESRGENSWGGVTVGSTSHPDNEPFRGMALPEAAQRLGLAPVEAALVILDRDGLKTSAFFHGISTENMRRVLAEPCVMIGSDASIRSPTGPLSHDYPHPRAYGTFPRVLRLSLGGETVPLPEAVRKMTSLPARQYRLASRGVVRRGMKADLVVFSPRTVRDMSTYARPHQFAAGIQHVVVNGVLTLREGALTGRRGGRVL